MLRVIASCATLPRTGNLLGVMPSDHTSHGCTSRHHQLCNQTSRYLGMLQDTWLHNKDTKSGSQLCNSARDNMHCLFAQAVVSLVVPRPLRTGLGTRLHQLCNRTSSYLGMLNDTWLHNTVPVVFPASFDDHIMHHKQVLHSCSSILVRDTGNGF